MIDLQLMALLLTPLTGGLLLAVIRFAQLGGGAEFADEFLHLCRGCGADHARDRFGAASRIQRGILHRPVQCIPGRADRIRRVHHLAVLAPLYAHRAASRQAHHADAASVLQHVPDVHFGHAGGADLQQHGHHLGGDGSGHADHRAAGQPVPHAGQHRGGVEIFHPVRGGHRARPVRHHPAVFRRRARARRRRHGPAVDAFEPGQGRARTHGSQIGIRISAGRLRHQGRPGAVAQLAAGCACGRPHAGLRGAFRPAAECRVMRGDAQQGIGGWFD